MTNGAAEGVVIEGTWRFNIPGTRIWFSVGNDVTDVDREEVRRWNFGESDGIGACVVIADLADLDGVDTCHGQLDSPHVSEVELLGIDLYPRRI